MKRFLSVVFAMMLMCCTRTVSALPWYEQALSEFYMIYELVEFYEVNLEFDETTAGSKCLIVSDQSKVMVLIHYEPTRAVLEVRKRHDSTWVPNPYTDWSSILYTEFPGIRTFNFVSETVSHPFPSKPKS